MSMALVVIGVALIVAGMVVLLLQPARERAREAPLPAPAARAEPREAPRAEPREAPRIEPRREPPVVLTGAPWPTTSGESLPLERAAPAPSAPRATPGRDAVRLRLAVSDPTGSSERLVTLHDRHVAGRRAPDEALRFPDDACMSARHCELSVEEGAVMLRDLDSSNGTIVNGVPVLAGQRYRLDDGDRIRIGDTELMVAFVEGGRPASREAR